jgi:hypothetical protein
LLCTDISRSSDAVNVCVAYWGKVGGNHGVPESMASTPEIIGYSDASVLATFGIHVKHERVVALGVFVIAQVG